MAAKQIIYDQPLEHILSRGLPKWPAMLVQGKPIKIAQAKEIVRRTDVFFEFPEFAGNDAAYRNRAMELLRIPQAFNTVPRMVAFTRQDEWRRQWGYIDTSYVKNNWIASSYIYGPHGWVHPSGKIEYARNVGKWPSNREVRDDWAILAREFPFIDLTVVLMDGEYMEDGIKPVCGFKVQNGSVMIFDPLTTPDVMESAPPIPSTDDDLENSPIFGYAYEHGLPFQWLEDWAAEHVIDLGHFDASAAVTE